MGDAIWADSLFLRQPSGGGGCHVLPPTIALSTILSQPFISIRFHLNRSICQLFSLSLFRKPTLIFPVQNPIHFQHLPDPNSISTAYHFTTNSSPSGKRTSSVFWFLLNGLRDRNPRHWNSRQRRLDLQGVRHSGRQASSLRRHCSTLCR